eukprot:350874-Chlamydomonas_euryale.AAC.5
MNISGAEPEPEKRCAVQVAVTQHRRSCHAAKAQPPHVTMWAASICCYLMPARMLCNCRRSSTEASKHVLPAASKSEGHRRLG